MKVVPTKQLIVVHVRGIIMDTIIAAKVDALNEPRREVFALDMGQHERPVTTKAVQTKYSREEFVLGMEPK